MRSVLRVALGLALLGAGAVGPVDSAAAADPIVVVGQVTDVDGEPVVGIVVTALGLPPMPAEPAVTTGPTGRFRIEIADAGRYCVSFNGDVPGGSQARPEFLNELRPFTRPSMATPNGACLGRDLAAGQRAVINVTMHRPAALSGEVRLASGGAASGQRVALLGPRARFEMFIGSSNTRGVYRFSGLRPGTYTVAVGPLGNQQYYRRALRPRDAAPVPVASGASVRLAVMRLR